MKNKILPTCLQGNYGDSLGELEGLAQWLRSLPPNPEVPGSIPGLVKG